MQQLAKSPICFEHTSSKTKTHLSEASLQPSEPPGVPRETAWDAQRDKHTDTNYKVEQWGESFASARICL